MGGTVLILGASGKIGSHAARAFAAAGWTVRRWTRGTDMTAAAAGADVIVNGLNPPGYHDWARQIPAITAQVIAAARASGATVIVPGNVYVFGDAGGVWSEHTPHRPVTRKGRIRAEMEAAYRDSGVRTILLRAGNFIDSDGNGDVMQLLILRDIARGRLTRAGGADVMQAYAYVPDWARAAVMLAARRADLPTFADIPFPGHAFTMTALQADLSAATGRTLRMVGFPWWLMRLLSPVWELAREMVEMRYLWDTPHQLAGDTFARLLPDFRATDLQSVMRAGLASEVDPDEVMRPRSGEIVGR
jgi:nucleoside-diphosphate-sugar epimerase